MRKTTDNRTDSKEGDATERSRSRHRSETGDATHDRDAPAREHVAPGGGSQLLGRLQRGAGNQAIQRAVERGDVRVNEPGDGYEREADTVARRVLSGRVAPSISRTGPDDGPARSPGDGAEASVQASDGDSGGRVNDRGVGDETESAVSRALDRTGSGRPMLESVRTPIEQSLRRDFSGVRVHDDALAHTAAREIHARAFTHGRDVWLGSGAAATDLGLMAHEATHVVQQEGVAGSIVQRQEQGEEPLTTPLDATSDVSGGAGAVAEYEAVLRDLYRRSDEGIYQTAQDMLENGVPEDEVAKWATEARNQAKAKIRKFDMTVVKKLAEQRNLRKYGDELGPSYKQLRYGDPEFDIAPRSDDEVVKSAKKTNLKVNRWTGRLRIAGRIMIAVDIGIAGYNVISAPESEQWRTAASELGGLAGAAAGGVAGAKLGGMIGGGIGAWFGGAGAIPGAAIGGVIGGIGGAIGGGIGGRALGEYVYDLFPPEETQFEGEFQ